MEQSLKQGFETFKTNITNTKSPIFWAMMITGAITVAVITFGKIRLWGRKRSKYKR